MSIRHLSELVAMAALTAGALASWDARAEPPPLLSNVPPGEARLSSYRERFKLGMDRYKADAPAEAIAYWEPIYRELGPHTGYRLAYDLGVAYLAFGEATLAAERIQAFLDEVDARRLRGDSVESLVEKEEADARARMANLVETKGRINVARGSPPRVAQVDAGEPRLGGFVAWVTPGIHSVTFAPGTADAQSRTAELKAGEIVDMAPPVEAPSQTPSGSFEPRGQARVPPPTVIAAPLGPVRHETTRPFSVHVLYTGAGIALATGVVFALLENHASVLRQRLVNEEQASGHIPQRERDAFEAARSAAYAALGGAIGIGTATIGLALWYGVGTPREMTHPTRRQVARIRPDVRWGTDGVIAGFVEEF